MPLIERPRLLSAFLVLVLTILLAGDAWRYTIGWWAYGALAILVGATSVWILIALRDRWRFQNLPNPLIAFLGLATISIAWSFYPGATALGLAATWLTAITAFAIAVAFSWEQILAGLGMSLRIVLGASVLFELFVALIMRRPILPLVPSPGVDYSTLDTVPKMLYWSRNELLQVFDGGKVQGIVGNSVLLSFVAIVGIIVFSLQLADRTVKRRWGILWLVVSVAALAGSRSATIIAALGAVVIVALAIVLIRRARTRREKLVTYGGILAALAVVAALVLALHEQLFALLGKSDDLTGRVEIWGKVIALAQERPVQGWGWVSHWVPWVAPFDDLVFRNGVRQLHAHSAWIDMWFQLGIIGLVVFGALVLSTLQRTWLLAVDRPQVVASGPGPYTATSLLPLLVLVALLVQSVAESRLLVEFGFAFLVLIAIKTKAPDAAAFEPLPSGTAAR